MSPFDQVMAQQALVGESSGEHSIERPHIVDSLSVVGAFPGEVLVDVGNRAGVRIDPTRIGEQAAEKGGARARRRGADARLDDRVRSGLHPSRLIEARLVQRMGQRLDHAAGGARRELGVAVQRDHEPDISQGGGVADADQACGVLWPGARDEPVQLFQLAPLALPADELLLGFAPGALAMEKEEPPVAVAPVQGFQVADHSLQEMGVVVAPSIIPRRGSL